MYKNREKIYSIAAVSLSFCTAIAISMQFQLPELTEYQKSNIVSEILWNLCKSLDRGGVNATLIWGCLLFLNHKIIKEAKNRNLHINMISLGISIVWLAAESFKIDNTLRTIIASPGQIIKSMFYILGIAWLLSRLGYLLFRALNYPYAFTFHMEIINKHPFLCPFLLLLICWIPHIIICYPCYGVYGTWSALGQVYGISKFTAHLPPIYTLLISYIVKLSEYFGNCNAGLFLCVMLQTLVFAIILSYMIYTLKVYLYSPKWLIFLILLCAVFVPYYSAYLGVLLRDNLYSYSVLLFVIELLYMLLWDLHFFKHKKHCILLGLSILGSIWFRKNGIYIVIPTLSVFFLYILFRSKRLDKPKRKYYMSYVFIILFLPVILANITSQYVMMHYEIAPGSIREALSLPFQQTARYVSEYGDEISEEEADVISKVLDYEHLAENYDPRISDPVKRTYNNHATKEDLKQYFIVWLKQFFKHPIVYIKATLNQNYYILYPYTKNDMIYTRIAQGGSPPKIVNQLSKQLNIYEPESLISFKTTIEAFYKVLFVLPIFGILSNLAFYNIILVFCFVFSVQQKKYQWIILALPLFFSNAIIILAPAIQMHPRYAFPVFYTAPVVIAFYIYLVSFKRD